MINKKHDRQGVRTPVDIERKYDLGRDISEIERIATNAQRTASNAQSVANNAAELAEEVAQDVEAMGGQVNDLSSSVAIHSENILNLDERVDALEESGGGEQGESGATFTPSVDSAANLSWTNDKGLPNPATVNIKGDKGDKGDSPVKGTDYWTDTDKQEIVNDVLAALPVYNGEVEDV